MGTVYQGLGTFITLIVSVILFCVFIGMFIRLGRIDKTLKKMAIHSGAMTEAEANAMNPFFEKAIHGSSPTRK